MVTLIIIGILVVVLILILMLRIVLSIDTIKEEYFVQAGQVVKFSMVGNGIMLKPQLRIFWWNVKLKSSADKKDAQKAKKEKKSSKRTASSFLDKRMKKKMKLGLKVVKSFQVKKFNLELDTGDNLLNAYLYPLCWFLASDNRKLNINWTDQNHLVLRLEGRVVRMIYFMLWK